MRGAALLVAATAAALVWANVSDSYADLWGTHLRVGGGSLVIDEDLGHWVNDLLMAVFFLVVGLEIRREFSLGELRDRRAAFAPAAAALAGMVVPVALYLAVNAGGEGAGGWGIVMATDIAFVLGAVALLGRRLGAGVRTFLLTLAIVDDIGAVLVIAVVYAGGIELAALAGAAAVLAAIVLAQRARAWPPLAYAVAGVVLWLFTYASGVHPTIAGVALGLVIPVHATHRESLSQRFQAALEPWSAYLVVPLFALANAGVALSGDAVARAAGSAITIGVVVGLVAGKALGVSGASLLALRSGAGRLPSGMSRAQLPSAAALAGIGFTVSLFVADLAFDSEVLREEAKVGVLMASVIAALLGAALARRQSSASPSA